MPDVNPQDIEKTLKDIQNIAIILTGATEYVCEARMLKRLSGSMEKHLEKLEDDIASLREKFPGRFPQTLDPDNSFKNIRNIAITLKRGGSSLEAKCRAGELGNELSRKVMELKVNVITICDAISGKVSRYTFMDKITGYAGKIKSTLLSLSPLISNTGRLLLAVILVIALSFFYLILTMESETDLLKSIKKDGAYLEEQRDLFGNRKKEYEETLEKIKYFNNNEDFLRENKVEFLNLSVQEKKLKDFLEKAMIFIETKEKNLEEKNRKLEEIRKKSFFQKLLKR
ncbi:MAG TPA: hypothetical protein VMW42_06090 [Desulfatiglandales bacterium]|nr:hypothetical protein [Desulfatiglandales bacterium]